MRESGAPTVDVVCPGNSRPKRLGVGQAALQLPLGPRKRLLRWRQAYNNALIGRWFQNVMRWMLTVSPHISPSIFPDISATAPRAIPNRPTDSHTALCCIYSLPLKSPVTYYLSMPNGR
jgi:hypothetical protein